MIDLKIITSSLSEEFISISKSKTNLAESLDVNTKRMFQRSNRNVFLHSEKAACTFTERKARSDAITEDVRRTIYEF